MLEEVYSDVKKLSPKQLSNFQFINLKSLNTSSRFNWASANWGLRIFEGFNIFFYANFISVERPKKKEKPTSNLHYHRCNLRNDNKIK